MQYRIYCTQAFHPDPSDPVVSPSLMKPEWSDLSRFKFNPAFTLGLEYECIKECLDWIPDESVLLDDYNEATIASVLPLLSHHDLNYH